MSPSSSTSGCQTRCYGSADRTFGGVTDARYRAAPDADAEISRYRDTLDAGGDLALFAGWFTEATTTKKTAQARLGLTEAPPQRMTETHLGEIAEASNDLFELLRDADPRDRAELYSRISLRLTYQPGPETLMAEVCTPADLRVFDGVRRGT